MLLLKASLHHCSHLQLPQLMTALSGKGAAGAAAFGLGFFHWFGVFQFSRFLVFDEELSVFRGSGNLLSLGHRG